ncbi:inclusion body family protein [Burkholderia ambifaria]|uniref:inclusion body family protein n=1 Tax=Burkholderia ambifaria TaxID=152480 RepID=UPI001B9029D8|nr:inclusion body family protein [Burkholderia ambifaria]MBR8330444.1 inclusion body family protein [Burkholderia ambifaria]
MEVDLNSINLEQTAQFIQILAVIDAHYVKATYPNPSRNPYSPTAISNNAVFMLNSRLPGVSSSEGTGGLGLKLHVGDKVSLMGTSLSDNSEDSAMIYNVRHYSGAQVFNPFVVHTIEQAAAPSAAETPDIIATSAQSQVFQSFSSVARSSGSENLGTIFALYTRNQNNKALFGYFFWTWQASAA